jgi:hypothetical protein
MSRHLTVALAICLGFVVSLRADQPDKLQPAENQNAFVDELAAKLKLTDRQKREIEQIHADYSRKAEPLQDQLLRLHVQEHEAMKRVLTDAQRAELPLVLKIIWDREWAAISDFLGLTREQWQGLSTIRDDYYRKFLDLEEKTAEENMPRQYRALRSQFFDAINHELTQEQRSQLAGILRNKFGQLLEPLGVQDHLETLARSLDLTTAEQAQLRYVHQQYADKAEKEIGERRQLQREEFRALDNVLNDKQRVEYRRLLGGERP